jgi:hypothetical protein
VASPANSNDLKRMTPIARNRKTTRRACERCHSGLAASPSQQDALRLFGEIATRGSPAIIA